MTPTQKQRVKDAVLQLIVEEYRVDFENAFKEYYRFFGELSVQANNGCRNALSHLGLALIAEDEAIADLEITRGHKHFAIATYDCLSVLLVKRLESIEGHIEVFEESKRRIPGHLTAQAGRN